MAEGKVIERTYNVPLRKGFMTAPKYRRAKKAMNTLKEFLVKHMKSENLFIGHHINQAIWKNGIKNPPHHIKIDVKKDETGKVFAEMSGVKLEVPKKAEDKKSKKEAKAPVDAKEMKEKIEAAVKSSAAPASKPVVKPAVAAKPAVKPAAKPVAKPAVASKPAATTAKPVAKPAAAKPAFKKIDKL